MRVVKTVLSSILFTSILAGCPNSRQEMIDDYGGKPLGDPTEYLLDQWPYEIPNKCWEEYERALVVVVSNKEVEDLCWSRVNGCYIRVTDCGWGEPLGCGEFSPVLVIREKAQALCSLEIHEAKHWLMGCSGKDPYSSHWDENVQPIPEINCEKVEKYHEDT